MTNIRGSLPSVPRQIFVPSPLLGWRLSPSRQLDVRFRPEIVHTTGADGWRTVVGQNDRSNLRIGFYGCSFTYGTALDDAETFTSLLQQQNNNTRILNRGVGGHGTVQSYLQFREDVANNDVDAAVFCVIGDHKYRNMPHPLRMKAFLTPDWYRIGVEHYPCAVTKAGGGVDVHYVPIWQPVLRQHNQDAFLPDEIMLNRLTIDIFLDVSACARDNRMPIHIVLLDHIDDIFNSMLIKEIDNITDVSTPHDTEHRFLPYDMHPNVYAASLYSDRLTPIVAKLADEVASK